MFRDMDRTTSSPATGLATATTGCCNIFYGVEAGRYNGTGSSNTFSGYVAGNCEVKGDGGKGRKDPAKLQNYFRGFPTR